MTHRFVAFLALLLVAGLAGCADTNPGGISVHRSSSYNPVAYQPHDPGAVRVRVSLSRQIVYVMEGDRPLLVAATNVGVAEKPTPRGDFRITKKIERKRSGTYGFYKNGDSIIKAERGKGQGEYIGYPTPFWCEFAPGYGFHLGYVWPEARTHGCLRLHRNVAPKFFALVRVGTPVNIADTQPEDATLGADIPHPTDYNDPDPPPAYMASDAVFDSSPGSGGLVPY